MDREKFKNNLEEKLVKVREWYKNRMDYEFPEISFVDINENEIRGLNDYTKNLIFMVNTLNHYKESVIKSWTTMIDRRLQERYKRRIRKEERDKISSIISSQLESSILPNSNSYPYSTIFVFPKARNEIPLQPDSEDQIEYNLTHELFHFIQYEKGFAGKYPFCNEQTAIFTAMSYDRDKGIFRNVFNTGNERFDQEMMGGVGVIMNVLKEGFKLDKDPLGLLGEVKMLLDEPCYRTINYYTFGRIIEPKLMIDGQIKI